MKLGISEILKKASEIKDEKMRIGWLRQNDSNVLRGILKGALDPSIEWQLPEGNPPYKENDLVDQQNILYSEYRRLYLFTKNGNPNLKQIRRESLFIELLESVDKDDAKLLLHMKDKNLPYPGVTKDIINKAFPGLI
jgi:hypothetical protein